MAKMSFTEKISKIIINASKRIIAPFLNTAFIQEIRIKSYHYVRRIDRQKSEDLIRHSYKIHPSVKWGKNTNIYGDGMIIIGESTYIGSNSFLLAHPKDARIDIGKFCAISHNVNIRTYSYRTDINFRDARLSPGVFSNIIINDYVWIGANVFISGGVNIGENSIVGSNSVVTHDIPANSIYGGVPARLIRYKDGITQDGFK